MFCHKCTYEFINSSSMEGRGRGCGQGFLVVGTISKEKKHQRVSSGWGSICLCLDTGLSTAQYEAILIIVGVRPFWVTLLLGQSNFDRFMVKSCFICWNCFCFFSGWHAIAAYGFVSALRVWVGDVLFIMYTDPASCFPMIFSSMWGRHIWSFCVKKGR